MDFTDCIKKEWDFLMPLKTTLKCKNVLNAATNDQGNIYITGTLQDDAKGGAQQFPSNSFLGKYDCNGKILWFKQVNTSFSVVTRSIAVDPQGNVYITGYTWVKSTGGDNNQDKDVYIARYSKDGEKRRCEEQLSLPGRAEGKNITTDSEGNIYISGYLRDSASSTKKGPADIFFAIFSKSGERQCIILNAFWCDETSGVVIDGKGCVCFVGVTNCELGEAKKGDIILAKYSGD